MKTFIFLFILSISLNSYAADIDGKFAVKGAGKHDCSSFIKAAQIKNTDYYLYGGWVEGFISSYNQFQPNSFDITPWQTTELILALLESHCRDNPKTKFLTATNSLIKTVFPIRLKNESNYVKIQVNESQMYFYQEIIKRSKKRLEKLGFLKNASYNSFTKEDAIAFENYQKTIGLDVTGVPDQKTLLSLFLKRIN